MYIYIYIYIYIYTCIYIIFVVLRILRAELFFRTINAIYIKYIIYYSEYFRFILISMINDRKILGSQSIFSMMCVCVHIHKNFYSSRFRFQIIFYSIKNF